MRWPAICGGVGVGLASILKLILVELKLVPTPINTKGFFKGTHTIEKSKISFSFPLLKPAPIVLWIRIRVDFLLGGLRN